MNEQECMDRRYEHSANQAALAAVLCAGRVEYIKSLFIALLSFFISLSLFLPLASLVFIFLSIRAHRGDVYK